MLFAMQRRQIETHTALRGVAALSVVAYHLQFGGGYHLGLETATDLFRRSYLFVDMFFILSGFIIAYANAADRTRPITASDYRSFLTSRFARIYPLHFFSLIAMAVLAVAMNVALALLHKRHGMPGTASEFLTQLALLNAWTGNAEYWNVPSWSISAEAAAYLLFPAAVALGVRSRAALLLALAATALAFFGWVGVARGNLDIISGLAPLRCLAGFSVGMLIYFARDRIAAAPDVLLSLVQIVAVVGIVALLVRPANDVAIIPFFAALVATTWTDRGLLPRIAVNRVTRFLGEISYSIYLTHVVLLSVFSWRRIDPIVALNPPLVRAVYLVFAFALVIIGSAITYRWVEKPARRWLARRLTGHGAPPITGTAPAP